MGEMRRGYLTEWRTVEVGRGGGFEVSFVSGGASAAARVGGQQTMGAGWVIGGEDGDWREGGMRG